MKFKNILRKILKEDESDKPTGNAKFDKIYSMVVPSKISFEDFKKIIKMDPTTAGVPDGFNWETAKKENFKSVLLGKFVNWLLKIFIKPGPDFQSNYQVGTEEYERDLHDYRERIIEEDVDMIGDLLLKYDKYMKRIVNEKDRNILNISGVEELSNILVRATNEGDEVRLIEFGGMVAPKRSKTEGDNAGVSNPQIRFKYPGSEILKVGSDYTLVRISNKGQLGSQAASHFGGYYLGSSNSSSNETNWCTSPENSSNFKNYIQQAPLYIFLANEDKGQVGIKTGLPKERYQIHLGSTYQAKDRLNTNFDFENQLANGKLAEFKEFFREEFKKGVSNYSFSAENKTGSEWLVKLNNRNIRAYEMYVKIYGDSDLVQQNPVELLNEALDNVPSTCATLTIANPTQIELSLDFSDKILSFTALRTLSIQNIAKSLPDGFDVFQKLAFLSLTNNKELTKLPSGVEDCPFIVFISLTGSENVVLSPEQLDVFEQEKDDYGRIEDPNFWVPK